MTPNPTKETANYLRDARIFSWLCRSYLACKAFEEAQRCADLARACWLKVRWDINHEN